MQKNYGRGILLSSLAIVYTRNSFSVVNDGEKYIAAKISLLPSYCTKKMRKDTINLNFSTKSARLTFQDQKALLQRPLLSLHF